MAKRYYKVTYSAGAFINNYFYPEGSVIALDLKANDKQPLWAQPCDAQGNPDSDVIVDEVLDINKKLGDALGNKMAAAAGEPAAIVLPPSTPAPAAVDATRNNQILETLKLLDPSDDAHWTKDGSPNINVLVETLGFKMTKAELTALAPDFKRPAATV